MLLSSMKLEVGFDLGSLFLGQGFIRIEQLWLAEQFELQLDLRLPGWPTGHNHFGARNEDPTREVRGQAYHD
jgi:hypothetical protein